MANLITPLVSIVFTSYNHEEYLKQAVESILNQSFKDFEFIIIDDCSTDNSREILKGYEQHPGVNIHFMEKNTGSYVKASHYGALQAKGKYLLFAQCDDYAEAHQLSRLVKGISIPGNNAGVTFSRSNLVDEHGNFISDDYSIRNKAFKTKCSNDVLITGAEMRSFLSYSCVIPNLSAALIERELYFKVGGLPEKYIMAADWAFWLELAEWTNFYYIAEPLNNFRQHQTTIRSSTKIDKQLMEIFTLFDDHVKLHHIEGKAKRDMFTGFGNIWFTYFLESPKAVSSSFFSFIGKISSKNKFMLYFLLSGTIKKVIAIIDK